MAGGAYQVTVSIVDQFTAQLDKFNAQLKKVQMQSAQTFAPFANFQNSLKQSYELITKGLGLDKIGNFMKSILDSALKIGKVFASLVGVGSLLSLGGIMSGLKAFGEQGLELTNQQNRTGMTASTVGALDTANYLAGGQKGALAAGMERSGDLAFAASYGLPEGMNASWLRSVHGISALRADGTAKTGDELLLDDRKIIRSYADPRQQSRAANMLGHSEAELPLLTSNDQEFAKRLQEAKQSAPTQKEIEQARELELQIRRLSNSFTGLANVLFKAMSPTVMKLMEEFRNWLDSTGASGQKNIQELADKFAQLGSWLEQAGPNLVQFSRTVQSWIPSLTTAKIAVEALVGSFVGFKIAGIILSITRVVAAIRAMQAASAASAAASLLWGNAMAAASSKVVAAVQAAAAAMQSSLMAVANNPAIKTLMLLYDVYNKASNMDKFSSQQDYDEKLHAIPKDSPLRRGIPEKDQEESEKRYQESHTPDGKRKDDSTSYNVPSMTIRPNVTTQDASIESLSKSRDDLQTKVDDLNKKISENTEATKTNTDATKPRNALPEVPAGQMPRLPWLGPSIANHFAQAPDRSNTPGQVEPAMMSQGLAQNFNPPAYEGPTPGNLANNMQKPSDYMGAWPGVGQAQPGITPLPKQVQVPALNSNAMPKNYIPGNRESFLAAFKDKAEQIGQQTGIDPKIILAQAALETNFGKSAPNNNYFGIKGQGSTQTTQEFVNGKMVTVAQNFAGYDNPNASFDGYQKFMLDNPRYKALREAKGLDAQLYALQQSGYATDPRYAQKLKQIINQYESSPVMTNNTQQTTPNNVIQFPQPLTGQAAPEIRMPEPSGAAVNMNTSPSKSDDNSDDASQSGSGSDNQINGHISVSIDHKNVPPNVRLSANAMGNAFRGPVNVSTRNLPGFNSYYG